MAQIEIVAIGKLKKKYDQQAFGEYLKRVGAFATIKITELKADTIDNNNIKKSIDAEGEKLLSYLEKKEDVIIYLLDEGGEEFTTKEFVERVADILPVVFVVGGAMGLSDKVKARYHSHVALSQLTMPHELARVVLMEQIYRALTIKVNKTYHY